MPEEVRETSMDDTIRDLLNKAPESVEEVPAQEETTAEPAEAKSERPRDESGRFAKKASAELETAPQPPEDTGASAPVSAEPPLVTTTGNPIDINRAPASWKPAAKAAWNTIPEPVRAEIYRRESDFLNGNKGIKEHADFGQAMRQTIDPYRMLIESEGGTPEKAVGELLKTAALFRVGSPQQKLQAILGLDRQYNAGLQSYFQQAVQQEVARANGQAYQQPQQAPNFQDPRVDQILASLQAQERARAQQEEAQSNAATERFMSAKDASGAPLYPFIDNVLDDMSLRVSHIRKANPSVSHEEVLKQAYEAAVWANPETRQVLIGQQQAQQQASAETLRKSEAAKRAASMNLPKRGSVPAGAAKGSMEDTIRETYAALTG